MSDCPRALLRVCLSVWVLTIAACDSSDDSSPGGQGAAPTSTPSSPTVPLLVDVTGEAGITFVHDPVANGDYLFPEINGAGCAFLDYDQDGWLDIYLVQSGRDMKKPSAPAKPNVLYRNRGDGTFEDVTGASGAGDTGYGQGVAWGDYNNDGAPDIYVANAGGPDALLRNNGDGTFTNVTRQVGIDNPGYGIAPAFLDYDADGWLDIYVGNYVRWEADRNVKCFQETTGIRDYCGPNNYLPEPDRLFHNNGDGTFTEVSEEAGLGAAIGPGMSSICADFNDDGRIDIYAANDQASNQLWINQGEGTFVDMAVSLGNAVNAEGMAEASMGTNAEDFDGDLDLDLWLNHFGNQTSTFYLNEGEYFSDMSDVTGLSVITLPYTSFGAVVFDLRNDGELHTYVGNGKAIRLGKNLKEDNPYVQRDQVIHWERQSRRFRDVTDEMGPAMDYLGVSRGVVKGDYDNDGDMDILILNNRGPARLLRNDAANATANHWLMVRAIGPGGKRDELGAKVYVTADGQTRRQDLMVAHSYCSASDGRLHFGLGAASRVEQVRVRWLDGTDSIVTDVQADHLVTIRHPAAGPVSKPVDRTEAKR